MLFSIRMLLLSVHFIVASLVGLIVCLFRPFNPDNSRIAGRLYASLALPIMGVRLKADPLPTRATPCVYVANHQSNYDLFIMGGLIAPRTVSLGKKSLKWVPLFGQLYWLSGNVLIDRGNVMRSRQSMLKTTETLRHRNTSIWFFAEGTRNPSGELLPFKKGAFQMAIAAGVPIVPVCASSYMKHIDLNRWNSGRILLDSLPEIPTAGLTAEDVPALLAQCQTQMQQRIRELDSQVA
ncbi:1-acylglycerol-3-phosphate O-acyltransferase [Allohahella marinimesophila]|uniref:1-acyl-sn-glycerol-3-phosphate acyltransferase n=1 Tax=Allohahella marinimesophila TaxID=1054972 RepID=A0ABP7NLZ0_9GAMM